MQQNGINILVIDDDKDVCEFLKKFLTEEGYNVKTLLKPVQALKELERKRYHLIILDLKMPDIRGEDLLKEIKKQNSDLCVIILTAYPSIDSAVETLKNDAFDYIKKPYKLNFLRDKIKKALRSKGLLLKPEEELNKKIGEKLRELRKEKKLTLKQLAERADVSVSLVSQIERAESAASVSTLSKISRALDIEMKDLFSYQ
jgi:two-component system, OmpR family, response regulator